MNNGLVDSVRRLYEANRLELYAYALSLTASEEAAEDALGTAFAHVLRRGRCPRALRPYVFRAVRNAAIDEHRARARRQAGIGLIAPPEEAAPHEGRELLEELEQALDGLADDERECIVLKTMSGLTFREIGRVKGVSLNTAASWYRRGVSKLRERLGDMEA